MVNIDAVDCHFEAVAYLRPHEKGQLITVAYLSTENCTPENSATAYTFPIDPRTGFQTSWDAIKSSFPEGMTFSREAKVTLSVSGDQLTFEAESDIGVSVKATLCRPPQQEDSKIVGQKMSWSEFKEHVATISKSDYIFRGQQKPWPLCTSFHRRGRFRMSEFTSKDVKQLFQRLSAITSHYFDLTNPDQNGAFFNLLQHHGYPTPLLDWSHSPYVAAFFAFRDLPIGYDGEETVRIYIFNNKAWQKCFNQVKNLDPPYPHLSVMEFLAVANPRLVPQQAVTTVTNLYDIEAYINEKSAESGAKFLVAIDMPAREREMAMLDLRFMGITAGAMFPGIDGVCEEMRERNFDR